MHRVVPTLKAYITLKTISITPSLIKLKQSTKEELTQFKIQPVDKEKRGSLETVSATEQPRCSWRGALFKYTLIPSSSSE